MRRISTTIAVSTAIAAATALLPATVSTAQPTAGAALTCLARTPYHGLRTTLLRLATAGSGQKLTFRKLYYGNCGTTFYADLFLFGSKTGDTDQPGQFSRKAGGKWRNIGDGGCDPTNTQIPSKLKRLWKVCGR
jgi:hypothetical protein